VRLGVACDGFIPEGGQETLGEERKAKVLEAIDEGFREVLGESSSRAIYYYFRMRTGLKIEDAVERPEALVSFLRDMFKAGAQVLERRVFEKLCVAFEVNPGESKEPTSSPS
jgi:hypothetical protein